MGIPSISLASFLFFFNSLRHHLLTCCVWFLFGLGSCTKPFSEFLLLYQIKKPMNLGFAKDNSYIGYDK